MSFGGYSYSSCLPHDEAQFHTQFSQKRLTLNMLHGAFAHYIAIQTSTSLVQTYTYCDVVFRPLKTCTVQLECPHP